MRPSFVGGTPVDVEKPAGALSLEAITVAAIVRKDDRTSVRKPL